MSCKLGLWPDSADRLLPVFSEVVGYAVLSRLVAGRWIRLLNPASLR
jgi:hypothetical protein